LDGFPPPPPPPPARARAHWLTTSHCPYLWIWSSATVRGPQIVAQELVRLASESRDIHFCGARYMPPGCLPPKQPIGTPLRHCIKILPHAPPPAVSPGAVGESPESSPSPPQRQKKQPIFLRMTREMEKVNFTKELWEALRGNLVDVADWIADKNRLGVKDVGSSVGEA
jgi:hypothetical protein